MLIDSIGCATVIVAMIVVAFWMYALNYRFSDDRILTKSRATGIIRTAPNKIWARTASDETELTLVLEGTKCKQCIEL